MLQCVRAELAKARRRALGVAEEEAVHETVPRRAPDGRSYGSDQYFESETDGTVGDGLRKPHLQNFTFMVFRKRLRRELRKKPKYDDEE